MGYNFSPELRIAVLSSEDICDASVRNDNIRDRIVFGGGMAQMYASSIKKNPLASPNLVQSFGETPGIVNLTRVLSEKFETGDEKPFYFDDGHNHIFQHMDFEDDIAQVDYILPYFKGELKDKDNETLSFDGEGGAKLSFYKRLLTGEELHKSLGLVETCLNLGISDSFSSFILEGVEASDNVRVFRSSLRIIDYVLTDNTIKEYPSGDRKEIYDSLDNFGINDCVFYEDVDLRNLFSVDYLRLNKVLFGKSFNITDIEVKVLDIFGVESGDPKKSRFDYSQIVLRASAGSINIVNSNLGNVIIPSADNKPNIFVKDSNIHDLYLFSDELDSLSINNAYVNNLYLKNFGRKFKLELNHAVFDKIFLSKEYFNSEKSDWIEKADSHVFDKDEYHGVSIKDFREFSENNYFNNSIFHPSLENYLSQERFP